MSEQSNLSSREWSEADAMSKGGLRAPAHYGTLRKIWWWFNLLVLVQVARLRFIAILALIGATILYWDTLMSYYERWTRPLGGEAAVASSNTEYWCPMHPTIIREKPDKCPICGMPLSKRKKGEKTDEEEALPPGVVSRVQLTPWKVVNSGVQTVEVGYQPLAKEITTVGVVEYDERKLHRITARPAGKSRIDKLFVNVTGQRVQEGEALAELYSPELVSTVQNLLDAGQGGSPTVAASARDRLRLWGIDDSQIEKIIRDGKAITHLTIRSPISGYIIKKYQVEGEYVEEGMRLYDVADLSTIWIEAQVYEDQIAFLKGGLPVTATTKSFPNREFCGKVAFIYPFLDTATRTVKVRFDMHNPDNELRRGMYATVTLQVPAVQLNGLAKDASEEQKRMHEQGLVLAVPERAVVDTGSRKIVYRESERDTFEGVDVQLGPRSGAFYPVLRGLQAGDRVVASGSFLIDAETRLTSGAASTYFGASSGPHGTESRSATAARPSMTRADEDKIQSALAKLSPGDRKLVETQVYCPVLTDNQLGFMGRPVKVIVKGQPVFLCCKSCVNKALADPPKTLAKLEEVRTRAKSGSVVAAHPSPAPDAGGSKSTKIKAMLAKLSPEDQRLAEEQGYCPESEQLLGTMGVPLKVTVKGQPVFLCCKSCEDDAREHADRTLAKVAELKAKTKTVSPQK
jgi:multidrug efflux pump subunit AcrA (membrane-fusion protein)